MRTIPCNPNAQPEVKEVLEYLSQIEGKGILTGQHTQTMEQPEIWRIEKLTGKLPAICGFELLSYSPNIRRETADEECLKEVDENTGTLEKAWEWAERGGLMTFTWHWFSPLGGNDKSFYAEKTDYDAAKAVMEGTSEHEALCHDLDHMAGVLQPFCDRHIPILWRPFHESEGEWFWWGAKGPEVAAELFRFMFRYYTQHHHLDNLIWVWNSPLPEGYVGDEYCDIISRDLYTEPHMHGAYEEQYEELLKVTKQDKGAALGETGILPDPEALMEKKVPWLWYMTWSFDFALNEKFNSDTALKKLYESSYAIDLEEYQRRRR